MVSEKITMLKFLCHASWQVSKTLSITQTHIFPASQNLNKFNLCKYREILIFPTVWKFLSLLATRQHSFPTCAIFKRRNFHHFSRVQIISSATRTTYGCQSLLKIQPSQQQQQRYRLYTVNLPCLHFHNCFGENPWPAYCFHSDHNHCTLLGTGSCLHKLIDTTTYPNKVIPTITRDKHPSLWYLHYVNNKCCLTQRQNSNSILKWLTIKIKTQMSWLFQTELNTTKTH